TRPGVNKKNRAYGPESAHVFEPTSFPDDCTGTPCKIFTVTLSVYDGTDTVTTTQAISVTDPDAVFAGNTFCINASGTDHTGCPLIPGTYADSAACITAGKCLTQVSFSTAITTYATAGRRVLFKKGDSFSNDVANIAFTGTLGIISSYGTGAKPIIINNVDNDLFNILGNVSDWRILNLDFNLNQLVPFADAASRFMRITGGSTTNKILIQGNTVRDGFHGIGMSSVLPTDQFDQIAVVENVFYGLVSNLTNGQATYLAGSRISYMGNSIDGTRSHNTRFPWSMKAVFSHNSFSKNSVTQPNSNRTTANMRLLGVDQTEGPGLYTEFVVVSDNKYESDAGSWMLEVHPQSNHNDERIRNVIVERNFFYPLFGASMAAVGVSGSTITLRNNVGNLSRETSSSGIDIDRQGACAPTCEPDPEYIFIYNNTFYTTNNDTDGTLRFIQIRSDVSATHPTTVKNNLVYAPNETGVYVVEDFATGTIASNNTTNPQALTNNPLFTNGTGTFSSMSDFQFLTGSYAKDAGAAVPVYRDFLGTLRPQNAPLYDMGAFEFASADVTAPTLTESSPIGSTADTTPSYTFTTNEAGSITYGGDCTSATTTALSGSNAITFATLSVATHSNCTITVTDSSLNTSTPLTVTSFTITSDTTPPTLTESSAIATSTNTTPDYTFSTTEAGSLTYGGDCTSSTTTATSGTNTITFATLSAGTHTNCTIQVTDASTNASTPLAITSFTITEETVPTPEVAGTSSSSKSKPKKKKISGNITYKKGERSAPWITLLTPTSNTATNKKFTIKATSKDKSGIQAMFVSINGIKKKRMNTDSILYTAKKRKNASITVSAYDTLGNVKIAQITITDGKVSGVRYY
ncbi:MAG: hypothetical protein QG581_41, partial [Patescibacteria group bacterium]|nr:hypothetical protein [Patescibacteria group bacterium]